MKILVTGGAGFIGANFLKLIVPRQTEHHFVNVDKLTYAANLMSLSELEGRSNYTFERVDIADYLDMIRIYALVLLDICGSA